MNFHHIGIIVKNLDQDSKHIKYIYNLSERSSSIHDSKINVKVQFFEDKNGLLYELIEPLKNNNGLIKLLDEQKNTIHHMAYQVDNIEDKVNFLRDNNFGILSKYFNAKAFNFKKVIFLHTPLNYVIELIEK